MLYRIWNENQRKAHGTADHHTTHLVQSNRDGVDGGGHPWEVCLKPFIFMLRVVKGSKVAGGRHEGAVGVSAPDYNLIWHPFKAH